MVIPCQFDLNIGFYAASKQFSRRYFPCFFVGIGSAIVSDKISMTYAENDLNPCLTHKLFCIQW
jgi:hypothetical protein